MRAKISCVICAYNEAPRIANVLSVVINHPLIDETIVVDDGSTDATKEQITVHAGVNLISHDTNKGKSHAIATGITHARNDLVMLLDADLIGLTKEDISGLAEPILTGNADASISLRKNSFRIHKLLKLDFTSGERVFSKSLIANYLDELRSMPAFGFEVFMNRLMIDRRYRIKIVQLKNVSHARKMGKGGYWRGLAAETHMIVDIIKMLSLKEIIWQNYALLSLALPEKNVRGRDSE